jgi:hypothetical protein
VSVIELCDQPCRLLDAAPALGDNKFKVAR